MRIVQSSAELISVTKDAVGLIENAGRTCYKSEDSATAGSADKFCEMLLKRGHESVIEHGVATFRIICDRGISHEIVRHRLASYSQESTRYCNYSKGKFNEEITVVEPTGLTQTQRDMWECACLSAESRYMALLSSGVPAQTARAVLPTCLKTELVMTANFREWRHFIKMRLAKGAHPDIRPIANTILLALYRESESVFKDLLPLSQAYISEVYGG